MQYFVATQILAATLLEGSGAGVTTAVNGRVVAGQPDGRSRLAAVGSPELADLYLARR
jgi:hypothetical protein